MPEHPNTKHPLYCESCMYADIYNAYEYRSWGRGVNITNVWCKKHLKNVRHPRERCPDRRIPPKKAIDSYDREQP